MHNTLFVTDLETLQAFLTDSHPSHEDVKYFFDWLMDNDRRVFVGQNTWIRIKAVLGENSDSIKILANVIFPQPISSPIDENLTDMQDAVILTFSSKIGLDKNIYLVSPAEYSNDFIQSTIAGDGFGLSNKIDCITPENLVKLLTDGKENK
ncbi:MAG: hypothetical protein AABW68_00575 [archaeon]